MQCYTVLTLTRRWELLESSELSAAISFMRKETCSWKIQVNCVHFIRHPVNKTYPTDAGVNAMLGMNHSQWMIRVRYNEMLATDDAWFLHDDTELMTRLAKVIKSSKTGETEKR